MKKPPQKIVQDRDVVTLYPCTYRILMHLNQRGFSPERKATVLQVFGQIIEDETGSDAAALLDLAERVNHAEEQIKWLAER